MNWVKMTFRKDFFATLREYSSLPIQTTDKSLDLQRELKEQKKKNAELEDEITKLRARLLMK